MSRDRVLDVPGDLLRRAIPRRSAAVEILTSDGVLSRVDEGTEQMQQIGGKGRARSEVEPASFRWLLWRAGAGFPDQGFARAAPPPGRPIGAPLQEKRHGKLLGIERLAKMRKGNGQESQLANQLTKPSLSVALRDFERPWCGSRHGYLTPRV